MKQDLKYTLKLLIILLTCSIATPAFAIGTEDSLGRSRLKESLNKTITITRDGAWTEKTGRNTGINRRTIICPPRYKNTQQKYLKNTPYSRQGFGYYADKYNIRGRCRP